MSGITHSQAQAVRTPRATRLRTAAVVAAVVAAFALAAVLALALGDGDAPSSAAPAPAAQQSISQPGVRYDGGPEEGSRGFGDLSAPNPGRPDGGPEEGTRGPGR